MRRDSLLRLLAILSLLVLPSVCWSLQHQVKGQASQIVDLDFSANERFLAVAYINGKVLIYNTINFAIEHTFIFGSQVPKGLRFSKNNVFLGIAYNHNDVKILSAVPPFAVTRTHGTTSNNNVASVDFNSDSGTMLTCGDDAKFTQWSTTTWNSVNNKNVGTNAKFCRYGPSNRVGYITTSDDFFYYDPSNSNNQIVTNTAQKWVRADFKSDGTLISLAAFDRSNCYDLSVPGFSLNSRFTDTANLATTCYATDGSSFAYGGSGKHGIILDPSNNPNYSLPTANRITSCRYTYTNTRIVFGESSGVINIVRNGFYTECEPGFYASAGSCLRCLSAITNCELCVNATVCHQCERGYYLNKATSICVRCDATRGCQECNATGFCTSCAPGMYILAAGTCEDCSVGVVGCLDCTSSSVCTLCDVDYYLTTGFSCSLCSVIPRCQRCLSSTVCLECGEGFYLATSQATCDRCSSGCSRCTSASNCLTCINGFYPSSGVCQQCSAGCISCAPSGTCISCAPSFYPSGGACVACPANCELCSTTGVCSVCGTGFFASSGSCSRCTSGCQICNGATCYSCKLGYYITGTTCAACSGLTSNCVRCSQSTCLNCMVGYYLTTGNLCNRCDLVMSNCVQCSSSTVCLACEVGLYHTGLTGSSSCARCSSNCLQCSTSASNCAECIPSYYLAGSTCTICPSKCRTCSSSSVCLTCESQHYLSTSNTCLSCAANLPNCLSCSSNSVCTDCAVGFYITAGNACQRCSTPCISCASSSTCWSCQVGYYLSGGACSSCSSPCSTCTSAASTCLSCQVGWTLSGITCNPCPTNCLQCDGATCTSCHEGFYVSSTSCVSCMTAVSNCLSCGSASSCYACAPGYALSSTSCVTCQSAIAGCQECSSMSVCTSCQQGSFLTAGGGSCTACAQNCLSCTSASSCQVCAPRYALIVASSTCQLCAATLPGCQHCLVPTTCLSCLTGYYLSGGSCTLCLNTIAGCMHCSSNSMCLHCQFNYYLDAGTNTCRKCTNINGCEVCTASNVCTKCLSGFYLSTNQCVMCPQTLIGCSACRSITQCDSCIANYYLHTDFTCRECQQATTNCLTCTATGTCLACRGGFYLTNTGTCQICATTGCNQCVSNNPSLCVNCLQSYYLTGSNTCTVCSTTIVGCRTCDSATSCSSCESGLYLSTPTLCKPCFQTLPGCSYCSSASTCVVCHTFYYLQSNGQCGSCDSVLPGCQVCSSNSQCLSCKNGFYLSGSTCQNCVSLPGCSICLSGTDCVACNTGYYLSSGSCGNCGLLIPNCFQCSSGSTCEVCLSGFTLSSGQCIEVLAPSSSSASSSFSLKTEYVDTGTLKHFLVASEVADSVSQVDWNKSCSAALRGPNDRKYDLNFRKTTRTGPKSMELITNNPLGSLSTAAAIGRLLQAGFNLDDYRIQLNMKKEAVQLMMPSLINAADISLLDPLNNPLFYSTFVLSQTPIDTTYLVTCLFIGLSLIFVYILAIFWFNPTVSEPGKLLPSLLLLKFGALCHYPISPLNYQVGFDFLAFEFPWLNKNFGAQFGDSVDNVPSVYVLNYVNLNIGSTYFLGLMLFMTVRGFHWLYWRNKTNEDSVKRRDQISSLIGYYFLIGLASNSCLSIQGLVGNTLTSLTISGFMHVVGVCVYILLAISLIAEVSTSRRSLPKLRGFLKASLLTFTHYSSLQIVCAAVILDIGLLILESKLDKLFTSKKWLASNIILNIALILLIVGPNTALVIWSVYSLALVALLVELWNLTTVFRPENALQENINKIIDEKIKIIDNQQIINGETTKPRNYNEETADNIWEITHQKTEEGQIPLRIYGTPESRQQLLESQATSPTQGGPMKSHRKEITAERNAHTTRSTSPTNQIFVSNTSRSTKSRIDRRKERQAKLAQSMPFVDAFDLTGEAQQNAETFIVADF